MAYFDKYGVEFSDDKKVLIKAPETLADKYIIPLEVEKIHQYAFRGCKMLETIGLNRWMQKERIKEHLIFCLEHTATKTASLVHFINADTTFYSWIHGMKKNEVWDILTRASNDERFSIGKASAKTMGEGLPISWTVPVVKWHTEIFDVHRVYNNRIIYGEIDRLKSILDTFEYGILFLPNIMPADDLVHRLVEGLSKDGGFLRTGIRLGKHWCVVGHFRESPDGWMVNSNSFLLDPRKYAWEEVHKFMEAMWCQNKVIEGV